MLSNSYSKAAGVAVFPKLTKFIQDGIATRTLRRGHLVSKLKPNHPLWETVKTEKSLGVDIYKLYPILGIPTHGNCKTCGGKTSIPHKGTYPSLYCSDQCRGGVFFGKRQAIEKPNTVELFA